MSIEFLRRRALTPFLLVGVASASLLLTSTRDAQAKRDGQNIACINCHEGQNPPTLSAEVSAARVEPGGSVVINVTARHASAVVGGVLVDSHKLGAFEVLDTMGTRLFAPTQAVHASPHLYMNGQLQFSFRWVAPAEVGVTTFEVWSNAGNDNMLPTDDSAGTTSTAVAVGCDALWYYPDADGDGFGEQKARKFSCEVLPGRITQGGDCDDKAPLLNPAATELCNGIDDNCDGAKDEGFMPTILFTDADGDGFGSTKGPTQIGCTPLANFASNFGDCDDAKPAINPNAVETPNGLDDNCNGQRDEVGATEDPGPVAAPAPGCSLSVTPAPGTRVALSLLLLAGAWRSRARRRCG